MFGKAGIVGIGPLRSARLPADDGAVDGIQGFKEILKMLIAGGTGNGVLQVVIPCLIGAPIFGSAAPVGTNSKPFAVKTGGVLRGQPAQLGFDVKSDGHKPMGLSLIAQIGDVFEVQNGP